MPPHSHELFATLCSSDGSIAWEELKIQLSGSNPDDTLFICFFFMSFPELSFWLKRAVHPCCLGLNAQRITGQLWRAVAVWASQHSVRQLSGPINHTAHSTGPTNAAKQEVTQAS